MYMYIDTYETIPRIHEMVETVRFSGCWSVAFPTRRAS